MTALVSIVSDNMLCVSSIDGNQHLYGKIAITPKRNDGEPVVFVSLAHALPV